MIGSLKGRVDFKSGTTIIVDVHGVGYKAQVSSEVLSKALIGQEIKIYTYTHVREDVLELFGFSSADDLKLFEQIIGISGIGPRTALNIFSIGTREAISEAIIKGDVEFFTQVPRLGKKNAQKLIIELKGKLGSLEDLDLSDEADGKSKEVMSVLKSFGFSVQEAKEAIKNIDKNAETVEEKVRLSLKYLGK